MTKDKPLFTTRLFGIFKVDGNEPFFSDILLKKETDDVSIPSFESISINSNTSYLGMLHPQVRKFLSGTNDESVKQYQLNGQLKDELNRTRWRSKAPKWAMEKLNDFLINEDKNC